MSKTLSDPALTAAENYERNVVTYTTGPFASILLEYANPQPGEHVVDIACGTGVVARLAAPLVGETGVIVGVDINPHMIAVGRSLPAPSGAAIDWREGSALALPLPDNSFDLALCQAGLQFIPDRPGALREMYRILKPGGRVALSVWRSIDHQPAGKIIWESIARHLNTTVETINPALSLGNAEELVALLEVAGFSGVTITARTYTVRQPRNPQLISQIFATVSGFLSHIAALDDSQRSALAQVVTAEIEPDFQIYIEGDEEIYPSSTHIALAIK